MIRNKAILNSDTVNRYGFRFSVGSLVDALESKALEGVPTCLGHDLHKPLGWTIPFGLYFEPGMCRLVGNQMIAETNEEQKFINENHLAALKIRYHKECSPYIEDFKRIIGNHLSKWATYLYAGCVYYHDEKIIERIFPKLFEKQDKNGLIFLSDLLKDFSYKGHGVFKHDKSEMAVIAHRYFRKSLSIHNNLNYFFIDELVKQSKNEKIEVRIALDRDLIGYTKTYHDTIELEYWRGPKFNNDVSKIKVGVSVHGSDEFQKLYYGISSTEFWWKRERRQQILEVEELKEHPSKGVSSDSYGCRYIHSIFDETSNSFEHFDGAIRMYDTEKMIARLDKDIKSAGKNSVYTKLFRIDGELGIADWKTLVCHYYQGNPLIHEYFDEAKEFEPEIIKEKNRSVVEELVPYSMMKGDGIRLFVSYHQIQKNESESERYISGYDTLSNEEQSLNVIESDILEIKKALVRIGSDLDLPQNVLLACTEDLYWNIPTISHQLNENLQDNISQTLEALRMVFQSNAEKEIDKVVAFSLSWDREDEKQVTLSVMGHCKDIFEWLNENKSIPLEKKLFKNWLEKQSTFINQYPIKEDSPPLFEMVCSDGVLYIRRRGIQPEIKYKLEFDDRNRILIAFEFPKEHFELAAAYQNRNIDVALCYLHKKKECSKCKGDYYTCSHSKTFDNNVFVNVTDFEFTGIIWTDRKA